MLVIVANQGDQAARELASHWRPYTAAVLTPADLSRKGWRYGLPPSEWASAVVDGRDVSTREITGVLTRMSGVYPQELGLIVPEDRPYVAAEMNAFLAAWLSGLACPVLNRPTPNCLNGPSWRREQWARLAVRLGVPVWPVCRSSINGSAAMPESSTLQRVVIVGNQCLGSTTPGLRVHARNLADAAGTELLSVTFTCPEDGSRFFEANSVPDASSAEVADAILIYMRGRARC